MVKLVLLFASFLFVLGCLEVAQLASFLPRQQSQLARGFANSSRVSTISVTDDAIRTTASPTISPSTSPNLQPVPSQDSQTTSTTSTTSTTTDPDSDDVVPSTASDVPTRGPPLVGPTTDQPDGKVAGNASKPLPPIVDEVASRNSNLELNILFYSVFIVYVSFIKLIYHNITMLKYNFNEPGILMIFGIIWELVVRQVSENQDAFPRFNSRIFFYLFLPSTVLESASMLSNKWLFLNLLPILIHSIVGTLLYALALGFSIYSLSKQSVFNLSQRQSASIYNQAEASAATTNLSTISPFGAAADIISDPADRGYRVSGAGAELSNLTLADCLIFGTILSSIDSTTMLSIFRLFQVNERLYYLVQGENLMNNAVVLVLFNLLLDFFNETRLTVVKIYIAVLQFFVTLIGSIFIGSFLAAIALVAVRLTKRFQVPSALSNFQNQYQAMIEILLILKLAYLAYNLASLAGTSRIVSLATFGILQDQYIKHNLNLRSQLTFRQVILATKTLGFSLVYPLLGMLLVEVANTSQFSQVWLAAATVASLPGESSSASFAGQPSPLRNRGHANMLSAASVAASKLSHLASQASLYWNFKFLALVAVLVVVYRFVVVISLSFVCNLFLSSQMKIMFKEQTLAAYGGLKGPLAMALVQRLIEHEEYRDRTLRNKYLFMYTILFITFVSTVIFGSFIKPIVVRVQVLASGNPFSSSRLSSKSTVVFDEINQRATEYVGHGINAILGHTKSPYDRFAELNETHIKPWLTRNGSNTNWLSVFYDNLILDETLNANCFHLSAEQSYASDRLSQQPEPRLRRRTSGRRRSSLQLETIDEHSSVRRRQLRLPVSTGRRSQVAPASSSDRRPQLEPGANEEALREFVMLNLKLDEAKRRKESLEPCTTRRRAADSSDETSARRDELGMLSTTSSDAGHEPSSPGRLAARDRHLDEIERSLRRLDERRVGKPRSVARRRKEPAEPVGAVQTPASDGLARGHKSAALKVKPRGSLGAGKRRR